MCAVAALLVDVRARFKPPVRCRLRKNAAWRPRTMDSPTRSPAVFRFGQSAPVDSPRVGTLEWPLVSLSAPSAFGAGYAAVSLFFVCCVVGGFVISPIRVRRWICGGFFSSVGCRRFRYFFVRLVLVLVLDDGGKKSRERKKRERKSRERKKRDRKKLGAEKAGARKAWPRYLVSVLMIASPSGPHLRDI